jgi:TPR repeat protein
MTRALSRLRGPALIACLALFPFAAVSGEPREDATPAPAFDAAAAWSSFLDTAQLGPAYEAFAVLAPLGYPDVDAARCKASAEALAESLRKVPVSIGLHHAALACAQATGDAAAADREAAVLAALSRHALAAASGFAHPRPIAVLAPVDARALVLLAGYKPVYEYYQERKAGRYFPLVIAALDAKAATERHFVFDFLDVDARIDHASPYAGYPANRQAIVDAVLEQQANGGYQAAHDLRAALEAMDLQEPRKKVERLKVMAAAGGSVSADTWIAVCALSPFDGCTDGLVDALLPLAEQRRAVAMVQLAFVYDQGLGIKADPAAADALLAAAERRWPGGHADVAFAQQWLTVHDGPPNARVLAILRRAEAAGNADATLTRTWRLEYGKDKPPLAPEDLERLAAPAANSVGTGERELSYYYDALGDEEKAAEWAARAASHGDPAAQADVAWRLLYGPKEGRDAARGMALLADAAQGGNAYAARLLASRKIDQGDWKAAEGWLLGAAGGADIPSIMMLASIYETDHPGLPGKPDVSVKAYEAFAGDGDEDLAPQARRRLSAMMLDGKGLPRDVDKAKALLLQDADKGDVESQWMLGMNLYHGRYGEPDVAGGVDWLQRAEKAGSRQARNSLAWYQCTSRNPEVADHAAGAERAEALDAPETNPDPAELDTLAACRAAVGDFERAASLQQRAIDDVLAMGELAEGSDAASSLARFRDRLALYRDRKPYVADTDE